MAAGAWTFYNEAKKYIVTGDIDLDTNNLRIGLFTSASNASTFTLSTYASVSNEVAEANGYSSSGKVLSNVTWASGRSAKEYKLDCTARIWTAAGGSISGVKYAVLFQSGGKLIAWSKLSTAAFSITTGNTLTITPDVTNGIFLLA